jgi:hypothetical protein
MEAFFVTKSSTCTYVEIFVFDQMFRSAIVILHLLSKFVCLKRKAR